MKLTHSVNQYDGSYWKAIISLLHQPRHASILAFTRISFGFLMMLDIPQERGMTKADIRFGNDMKDVCRFPMFSFLHPLNADYMAILYSILFLSAMGIMLGCFYRISCLFFTTIYWYFFLLDKSTWNNHSYLYGLFGFFFLISDAHRYMSVDGIFRRSIRNTHVPLWNYTVLRFQVFLVYFFAGLKKTDLDWLMGYSMHKLSKHWVFDPMRFIMDNSQLDLLVVHYGGFLLDISAGFLLFFDRTRIIGFILCGSFHVMNSQLFNIGMFPYTMLATMFVFCPDDSFHNFLSRWGCSNKRAVTQANSNCVYKSSGHVFNWKQTIASFVTILYIAEQLFLPYSHFITKGYNGWTEGPYGYSWDMMVHSFKNQHIKITYVDKHGEKGFLKPNAFLVSARSRWSAHPDMTIQYARCLKQRLIDMGIDEPSVYFDIWKSMNGRFQQRVVDPTVDMASYDWSPFKHPTFTLPVLSELSTWRSKLTSIKNEIRNQTLHVVFVADFPGLSLENFVQKDYKNTSVGVLQGSIKVSIPSRNKNVSLSAGEDVYVPANEFHVITTTSSSPSCYFYVYQNTTDQALQEQIDGLAKSLEKDGSDFNLGMSNNSLNDEDQMLIELYQQQEARNSASKRSAIENFLYFLFRKYSIFRRSFLVSYYAYRNVMFGQPDAEQVNEEKRFLDIFSYPRDKMTDDQTDSRHKTEL